MPPGGGGGPYAKMTLLRTVRICMLTILGNVFLVPFIH